MQWNRFVSFAMVIGLSACQAGFSLNTSGLTQATQTTRGGATSRQGGAAGSGAPQKAPAQSTADRDAKLYADIDAAKTAKDGAAIVRVYKGTGYAVDSDLGLTAAKALFDLGDMKSLSVGFMRNGEAGVAQYVLELLAKDRGQEKIVAAVKDYWNTANFSDEEGTWTAFNAQRAFLKSAQALDAALCPSLLRIIAAGKIAETPLETATALKCAIDEKMLARLLTHDDWFVRREAAITVGELRIKSLKPTLETLQFADPYWDSSSMQFPVRGAATLALAKLSTR